MISFFVYVWTTILYQPLFNALIWIYVNIAGENLGWAVVWLTVFLRIILLPLTIISERSAIRQEEAETEALKQASAYKHDQVMQEQTIRKVMKQYKISPWAKVITLLIQLLVLVLLYQVFVRGISGDKVIKFLYPGIDYPGKLNTDFYGFDIGHLHDSFWAGLCALYVLFSIVIENHGKKWSPGQAVYLFVFPLFTFFVLWILPMVKSLFILTTMIFSDTITLLRKLFFSAPKSEK